MHDPIHTLLDAIVCLMCMAKLQCAIVVSVKTKRGLVLQYRAYYRLYAHADDIFLPNSFTNPYNTLCKCINNA